MSDFRDIVPIADDDAPDYSEIFDAGQLMEFAIGINQAADGGVQAWTEVKEALGLVPVGTSEFKTNELKRDRDILREAAADTENLTGSDVSEFVGSALPLLAVPFGGTVRGAAALGGLSSTAFFQEDVRDSRAGDVLLGTVAGGLFGKLLLKGGKATQEANKAIDNFVGPTPKNPTVGPRQPAYNQFNGPTRPNTAMGPQRTRGWNIRQYQQQQIAAKQAAAQQSRAAAMQRAREAELSPYQKQGTPYDTAPQTTRETIEQAGLGADDFQLLGRDPIPGMKGIPKPHVKVPLTPAQRVLNKARQTAGKGESLVEKAKLKAKLAESRVKFIERARRKSEVAARRAKMEAAAAKRKLAAAEKTRKPHLVMKAKGMLQKAMQDEIAADTLSKAMKGFLTSLKAMKSGPSTFIKPNITGPLATATERPLTRAQAIKEILKINPKAKGLSKMKVGPLRATVDQLKGKGPSSIGNRQGGFLNTDGQGMGSGAILGGVAGAATASNLDTNPIVGGVAGAIGGGLAIRALARSMDNVKVHVDKKGMRNISAKSGELEDNVSRNLKAKVASKEMAAAILTDTKKVADDFMGATMTRLQQISPRIANALANTEFQQHFRANEWIGQGDKLFKRIADANLSDAQAQGYKIALLNSTANAKTYLQSLGKYDAADAVAEFEVMLAQVGDYLGTASLSAGLRKNYFPRMVVDTSKFEKIQEVNTYLESLAKKKGVSLTDFEKETALTEIINGALRAGSEDTAFGKASGNLQRRTRKVTSKDVDAYADPHQGFNDYIESVTNQVERRKFFQGQGVKVDDLGPNAENIDGVAARLAEQLKNGDLTKEQVEEVTELIRMRFGKGEQAPSRGVQNFKNLTYTGLLGNPMSALTQIGDLALSGYKNGVINTVSSALEQMAGRGKITGVDKEALLGIRNAAADFASKVKTRDVLNWTLKHSQFQRMDAFGKNTFINAALKRNKQLSKGEFKEKWSTMFDEKGLPETPKTDALFAKVQGFEKITPENKEDIGFMLWNELSSTQPIALSALPKRYHQHPNGRMGYMLQSFTLKVFDVMRKDIYNQVRLGNYKQAASNATKLSSLFVLTNGGVDSFKNFLTGKTDTLPEVMLNNVYKMFGVNKFTIDNIGSEGLGSTALKIIGPPMAIPDAIGNAKKTIGLIPLAGRNIAGAIE